QINLADDISFIKGTHQIGFGANYLRQAQHTLSTANAVGVITVSGQLSGMPLADFLLGNASAWSQGTNNLLDSRQNHIGLYVQDCWKIKSRVLLNYGIRWEPYVAPTDLHARWAHFDPALFSQNVHSIVYPNAPAGLIFPGDTQYTIGNHPEGNNWNKFYP